MCWTDADGIFNVVGGIWDPPNGQLYAKEGLIACIKCPEYAADPSGFTARAFKERRDK